MSVKRLFISALQTKTWNSYKNPSHAVFIPVHFENSGLMLTKNINSVFQKIRHKTNKRNNFQNWQRTFRYEFKNHADPWELKFKGSFKHSGAQY